MLNPTNNTCVAVFRSGLDSDDLVQRVWRQLIVCLKDTAMEQVSIKPSFVKVSFNHLSARFHYLGSHRYQAIIDALTNDTGESNQSAIDCCLFIGQHGKELDYKYEQLVGEHRLLN